MREGEQMKRFGTWASLLLALLLAACVLTAPAAAIQESEGSGDAPTAAARITLQPVSRSVQADKVAVFRVEAEGEDLTYRWQYSLDGINWADSVYASANSATLRFTARARFDGYLYRCVVGGVVSDSARLRVGAPPEITLQPADVTALAGRAGAFSVAAEGESLSYRWQYSADGGETWANSGYTSARSATLRFTAKAAFDGYLYRCVVTGECGSTVSGSAALRVCAPPEIALQPADVTALVGRAGAFTVAAEGESVSYRWQYSADGGETWSNSGYTSARSATLRFTAKAAFDGYLYRCVIKDAFGQSVVSDPARLRVVPAVPAADSSATDALPGLEWTLDLSGCLLLLTPAGRMDGVVCRAALYDGEGRLLSEGEAEAFSALRTRWIELGPAELPPEFSLCIELSGERTQWQFSTTEPDCTHKGYTLVTGPERSFFCCPAAPLGHDWDEWITLLETNGVDTGRREHACRVCGAREREAVYPETSLPILRIYGGLDGIGKYTAVPVTTSFEGAGISFSNWASLKYQGHTSLSFEKRNFTIKFYQDEAHGAADKYQFYNWNRESKYILKANWIDPSKCRNLVCADLWYEVCSCRDGTKHIKKLFHYGAVDGMPVAVYLNDDFIGLYDMVLHKDDDLYDLDKGQEDALMIINQQTMDESLFRAPAAFTDDSDWELEFCGTEEQTWAKEKLNETIAFINEASDEDFSNNKLLKQYFNIDSAIDYMLTMYALGLSDSYAKNLVLLSYSNDPWIFTMFDMEDAFGLFHDGSYLYPADWRLPSLVDGVWHSGTDSLLWDRMLRCYEGRVAARYAQLRETIFTEAHILAEVEKRLSAIPEEFLQADRALYPSMPALETETTAQISAYLGERFALMDAIFFPCVPES